ncbi:YqgE/AlgH family protein [Chitinophaga rhizophila]|uniref:YqgE/AlgH family protein n=1 Tax=Chitinophaga rhizophila TaxID=2866212 RepID=A0ABS7GLV4_9BACT|nr:YqgE/AlgH family protein [Chitinophaga rhizophila]MBW8687493.1 YqgE/AlgH family protein [Chitinophaga rhizophila]
MKAGNLIRSTALLDGTIFENVVILITELNEKGAMGFIVNRVFPRKLNELEEFKQGIPFPIYEGGPVDQEHLFFVHQRPDLVEGGTPINERFYFGGDFQATVRYINMGVLEEDEVRVFIGYCGWDSGELEAEIAEGSWQLTSPGAGDVWK